MLFYTKYQVPGRLEGLPLFWLRLTSSYGLGGLRPLYTKTRPPFVDVASLYLWSFLTSHC